MHIVSFAVKGKFDKTSKILKMLWKWLFATFPLAFSVTFSTSVCSELILLELWIEFGKTANRKYIPIFEIVKSLGPERAWCLTFFHSLTGYYKVLFSSSCGNREAWKTWQNYLWLTESLVKLCNNPTAKIIESKMNTFEKIFCLMYHAASTKYEVNKCRRQYFA